MESCLTLQDYSLRFGKKSVLDRISLNVRSNSIMAIVGPSGCGKSTLLHAIAGLLANGADVVTSGTLTLTSPEDYVGLVLQKPYPFALSIYENVALALRERRLNQKDLKARAQEALQRAHLWEEVKDRLDANALHLSGGQQQRLCLARVLALQPRLLLLDEPCSSLDPISTEKIEVTLRELRLSTTIVIVTHHLAQARRLSDDLSVLWDLNGCGARVLESGPTEDLFLNPQNQMARAYLTGFIG